MIIYFVTDIFYHDYESFVKLSVVFCEVHVHHSTSCSLVSNFSFISLIFVVDYKTLASVNVTTCNTRSVTLLIYRVAYVKRISYESLFFRTRL